MSRFVFLIVWDGERPPEPRSILRWVVSGLVALGIAAVIVWRVVSG